MKGAWHGTYTPHASWKKSRTRFRLWHGYLRSYCYERFINTYIFVDNLKPRFNVLCTNSSYIYYNFYTKFMVNVTVISH